MKFLQCLRLWFFVVFLTILVSTIGYSSIEKPLEGWTTKIYVVEVFDGDTITVEIRKRLKIRLLDCWAPETRTKDADEKKRGFAARDYMKSLAEGKEGVLFIPTEDDISKVFTFGRALGYVWIGDTNLSEEMVKKGHATKTKAD